MNTNETLRDEDTSMGIALKFAEKFQAHYPKKPIIPMMVELAKDIDSLVASRISELEGENKRLREKHRWIPVTERLPEESKRYLCYTPHFEDDPLIACIYEDGKWYEESFDITEWVTHWRPVQPPKEQ